MVSIITYYNIIILDGTTVVYAICRSPNGHYAAHTCISFISVRLSIYMYVRMEHLNPQRRIYINPLTPNDL
jgi:hypothetical protein